MRKQRGSFASWNGAQALVALQIAFIVATNVATNCGSERVSAAAENAAADDKAKESEVEPFRLGSLLKKSFDPPPLAELEKTALWVDRLVLDGMQVLRKKQELAGKPPVTVEEALALRNDSPTENAKLLAALGRVAPETGLGVNYERSWVRHVSGDLKSTNPLLISSVTEFEYQVMCGFALVAYDIDINYFAPSGNIVSWQTSADGLVDKMVLRDDMVWSDGKPITAQDVVFSFLAIMTDQVIIPAVRTGTEQLKWVEAYDDNTVVFFHKEALATNTLNMAFPIIPKHIYEKSLAEDPTMNRSDYHSQLEDKPVVGGPYELVRRVRNQEFVVRRRENYFRVGGKQVRPRPYFKEIRVKVIEDFNTALVALKAGQIEESMLRPEQWVSQTNGDEFYKRNTKVTDLEWTEFHFVWNLKSPFFSDPRVREAMAWAVDYDELLKVVCQGLYQQAQGPFHPESWMFPSDAAPPFYQDFDRAESLLEEAGWTDSDGDGVRDKMIDGQRVPFEFTLLTYQTETGIQASVLLKSSLEQIGVICNVKPTEFTVLVDSQQKKQFEAAMGGWGAGTDPFSSENMYGSDQPRNYGSYSNVEVDKLFKAGLRELDHEKRKKIYAEIHKLLWQDQPYTWLFYRNAFYGFSKKLRGYNFAPTGPYFFDPGMMSIYKPE